jgi:hypothetical protein
MPEGDVAKLVKQRTEACENHCFSNPPEAAGPLFLSSGTLSSVAAIGPTDLVRPAFHLLLPLAEQVMHGVMAVALRLGDIEEVLHDAEGTERVEEARVRRAGIHQVSGAELLHAPESLERSRVYQRLLQPREIYVPVDGVGDHLLWLEPVPRQVPRPASTHPLSEAPLRHGCRPSVPLIPRRSGGQSDGTNVRVRGLANLARAIRG